MKRYSSRSASGFARYGIKGHKLDRVNNYRGGERL